MILLGIGWVEDGKATDTGNGPAEPDQLGPVELIGSAETVDHFGDGLAGGRVAFVVGELVIRHNRAVFVLSLCRTQIHAYTDSVYSQLCQHII